MKKTVRIAAMIWGASILLSRFIGLIREAVIGRVLGDSPDADAYAAAFVIPDFLNYLLAGGVLSIVFIPIFQKHMAREDEAAGWEAFSVIANFLLVALSILCAVLWYFAPQLVVWVSPGFNAEQLANLVTLTRTILPAQIFLFIGGLLSAVLQARDAHTLPALAPLLYGGSIALVGALLGAQYGAQAFAWGVLAGAVLGPFMIPLYGCLKIGFKWQPILRLNHPDFKQYIKNILPIMIAFSVVVVDEWMVKRFASYLDQGTVAQLQYARTLMKVPMGVFGIATGVAAYPTIARLVAKGEQQSAYNTLIGSTRTLLVLAFAAQTGLTIAGKEVATVIYGTQRLNASALDNIGIFTGIMCLGLAAWSAQTVLVRGFYAMQNTWLPSLLGTVIMGAFYPIYNHLATHYQGMGLAAASSLAITTYVLVLGLLLKRHMHEGDPDAPKLVSVIVPMAVASALGIGAGLWLKPYLSELPPLFSGGIAGGLGTLICIGLAYAFRVPEVGVVMGKISGKVRRRLGR